MLERLEVFAGRSCAFSPAGAPVCQLGAFCTAGRELKALTP
jgi:hypothetical protein